MDGHKSTLNVINNYGTSIVDCIGIDNCQFTPKNVTPALMPCALTRGQVGTPSYEPFLNVTLVN